MSYPTSPTGAAAPQPIPPATVAAPAVPLSTAQKVRLWFMAILTGLAVILTLIGSLLIPVDNIGGGQMITDTSMSTIVVLVTVFIITDAILGPITLYRFLRPSPPRYAMPYPPQYPLPPATPPASYGGNYQQ